MWLHESESNSLIRQACKNKIFLTIIYISYNSRAGIYNMNMMENIISAVPERELVNNSAMF